LKDLFRTVLFHILVPFSSTMVFRSIGKFLLPTLERDLAQVIKTELSGVGQMTDSMFAPQVFGYASENASGAFARTSRAEAPQRLVKVEYPTSRQGMFD